MDVEKLREVCLSLPGSTEDVKWGNDLCFSVGQKLFCVSSMENPVSASLNPKLPLGNVNLTKTLEFHF